jgi:hypothetical protein
MQNKRDITVGLMFAGFGIAALLISRDYRMGTAARMGPGYFPTGIAILLVIVGGIEAVRGFWKGKAGLPSIAWHPLAAVTFSVTLFAAILNYGGLALSVFGLVWLSRLARPENRWRETLILSLVIAALCVAVFFFGLGINIQLWPRLFRG